MAPGALERLKGLPYHRYLIVTDPFVVSSGLIKLITDPLDRNSALYRIFDQVVPDPPIEKIVEGVQALTDFEPDSILCVGAAVPLTPPRPSGEVAIQTNPNRVRLPLIAIPTTSGTGSEVTSFSVISDPEHHTKYPLVADSLLPDEAILDVELVKSVPATVTANTGMDVFTHALESYVSLRYNEFSAALAEKAIEICGSYLLRSFLDNNDTHARQKMACGLHPGGTGLQRLRPGSEPRHGPPVGGSVPYPPRSCQRHAAAPHHRVQQ